MSHKLITHLQEYLGAHIEKISPNTQAVSDEVSHHPYDMLAQAAVPAVLVAFYKFTRTEDGVKEIIADNGKRPPFDYLLGDKTMEVVKRVAEYAKVTEVQADEVLDTVADECLRFVRNDLGSAFTPERLQLYFADQRQSILRYLPEDLQMGELLNDSTIDDRTNKMEGPASGLAKMIQDLFSSPGMEKKNVSEW